MMPRDIEPVYNAAEVDRLIAAKDAEIERLKEALEAVDDHGRALSFMETLKAKDAEIQRLKALITELADTLDNRPYRSAATITLIQRGREATR